MVEKVACMSPARLRQSSTSLSHLRPATCMGDPAARLPYLLLVPVRRINARSQRYRRAGFAFRLLGARPIF